MTRTHSLVTASLFTALMVVFSQITIPLPFSPVPLSLSLLAVFLAGGLLPPKLAGGSILAYVIMGVVGLPVFAGFLSGPGRILGPTGGYLVAYPLMALIVSLGLSGKQTPGFFRLVFWMLLSLAVCYLMGTAWMMAYTGKDALGVLGMAVFPFIPLDLCKALLAAAVSVRLRRQLPLCSSAAS